MHINNWVHASDVMKMVKSANSISTFSSEEGLPDNHVITIRERELTVDFPELIQNNIKTDTVTLDLDAEWDGIQPVIIFGPNADGTIAVEYTGEPVHIPGAVMQYVGGLDCSVMGLDDSGEVRLVTKAAPNTFEVVESGEYIGQISEDDVSLLGQILSAIKDAETATSDASSAAEAATAAANSANTAATKATDAANSANTAATKATDAANSANTASERAENAYDALTPIIAEIGVNGNQPRATTNPSHVATASDAYAAKPLEICIKGATRQNLWVNPSGTMRGVTVTSNADGSMTISGSTSGNNATIYAPNSYVLKPNTTYTVSCDKKIGAAVGISCFTITEHDSDGSQLTYHDFAYSDDSKPTTVTFTTQANAAYYRFRLYVSGNATVSGTYHIMLNEGSKPEPWCPPGLNGVDELSVVTAGKNLLKFEDDLQQVTRNGITFTPNEDGTVTVNGTATANDIDYYVVGTSWTVHAGTSLPASDLVFSTNGHAKLYGYDSDSKPVISIVLENGQQRIAASKAQACSKMLVYLSYNNGEGESNKRVYVQLELGSTATAYEPPTVTTTPIDLDGNTLNSLPDGTCDELTIDATGAVTLTKRTGVATYDGSSDERWVFDTDRIGLLNGAPGVSDVSNSENAYCDTLPVRSVENATAIMSYSGGWVDIRNSTQITSAETGKEWLASNPTTYVYPLATPQTIPLTAVTLPTLPSPNITVYHDSDVPSDITVEYVQDINIVLDNLNAKIAALNIAQSISS